MLLFNASLQALESRVYLETIIKHIHLLEVRCCVLFEFLVNGSGTRSLIVRSVFSCIVPSILVCAIGWLMI